MRKFLLIFLCLLMIPALRTQAFSDAGLKAEMHYIVISPGENGKAILKHMASYQNSADQEYKGKANSEGVLSIVLPNGASNLQVNDDGLGIKTTESGFYTTKTIPAKESMTIAYSYEMPADKEFAIEMDYDMEVMQVLVPEGAGSVEIAGAASSNQGLMEFDGQNFWLYNVQGLKAGQPVNVLYNKDKQPSGATGAAPEGNQPEAKENNQLGKVTKTSPDFHNPGHVRIWNQSALGAFNPHILMIVLGAILIAGISYYSYFRWKNRLEAEKLGADKEEKAFRQLLMRQNVIMEKIVGLEEAYSKGDMPEEEYQQKLAAFKQHLIEVKIKLRQFID